MSFLTNHNPNSNLLGAAGSGKIAIITGCASGVGLATTQLFLNHQYQVFGIDINEMDNSKIEEQDRGRFRFNKADLLGDGKCDEAVRACVEQFGEKIDVLANVAGIMDAFAAADVYTDKEWDRVMGINLNVPTRMTRAVLPVMRAKKAGAIINIASKASVSGAASGLAYTASKHALLGVTKHTAWRFRDEGIRCNAILPGGIDTNIGTSMVTENFDQEAYSRLVPVHALQVPPGERTMMPAINVANVILFLASEHASMMNGAMIPVDQGWSVI